MFNGKAPKEADYIQKHTLTGLATRREKARGKRLGLRAVSTLLVCTMLALLAVFGSSAALRSSRAYAVSVDGEQVAVLVSQREADEAVALALRQEEEKLLDETPADQTEPEDAAALTAPTATERESVLEFENQLSIEAVEPENAEYASVAQAADLLAQELSFTAQCVELLVDGEGVCYLPTSTHAIQAVNEAKTHYGSISQEDVIAVYTEQEISFNESTAPVADLSSVAEAANLLIYGDTGRTSPAQAAPLINVIVERRLTEVATLPYNTIRVDDDQLPRGQEEEVSPGRDGSQEISYTLVERNGRLVSKEQAGTTVLTAAVDAVINVGTKLMINGYGVVDLSWPLAEGTGVVSSRYGWRSRGWHSGIDVADPVGVTIVAVEAGVVTYADYEGGGYGNLVIIDHGDGLSTRYAHCDEFLVAAGDTVERDQAIATIGMTGTTTGPHVHFEVRVNDTAVDPAPYIGAD